MAISNCPKCTGATQEWTSAGVTLDHCRRCKGLWFDEGELSRHFANLGVVVEEGVEDGARATPYSCPSCDGSTLIEGRLGGVKVDTCQGCHGIFLDLGEVSELVGVSNRNRVPEDSVAAGFGNFALGLFIGANLGWK